VESLEKLQKLYKVDPSKIPERHVGVYIKDITDLVSVRVADAVEVRRLVRSLMTLVLDHVGGGAKLDKVDQNNLTPLHVAIDRRSDDCVELLLMRGADPDNKSGNETPRDYALMGKYPASTSNFQLKNLFLLHSLLNKWQSSSECGKHTGYFSLTVSRSSSDQKPRTQKHIIPVGLGTVFDCGPWSSKQTAEEYPSHQDSVWIHVPFVSVGVP
jgi:hypothetical protein